MKSLRDLTRSSGKKTSLRQWADDRGISIPLSLRQIMNAFTPPALRGFADLHAHPASHLAFGASREDPFGPFWGNPSCLPVELASTTIAIDLPPCDGFPHSPPTMDPVKDIQRIIIRVGVENMNILPHNPYGYPFCTSWPNANSVSHQQMHITCVHRAWQGGLRLMIASVTDVQSMSRMWNRGALDGHPDPTCDFDVQSARRQLQFIHQQADANSAWMQIATNSAEARQAVSNGKLALVLGVEMDTLTADDIIGLRTELGVCQVVPIHTANNSFGGVAVYDNFFNTNNWYLQKGKCLLPTDDPQCDLFYHVTGTNDLDFRLDTPKYLRPLSPLVDPVGLVLPPGTTMPPGIVVPVPISEDEYKDANRGLGGSVPDHQGHKNAEGLKLDRITQKPSELLKLMKAGFIIDLAHMSEESQQGAIEWAKKYGYPLVNTHTAMRPDDQPDEFKRRHGNKTSERDIPEGFVNALGDLGGVIGLGTSGYRSDSTKEPFDDVDQVCQWIDDYLKLWNAMHFRGVALGTDTNGLSPLIPKSRNPNKRFDYAEIGLAKSKIGTKEFDFADDGLAHYGMLTDFIEALRQYDRGKDIADYFLFRTAQDTIDMWERVEQAATRIP